MRLVDADALLEAIQDDWCKFCEYKQDRIHCLKMCNVYDVRRDIEDFPDMGDVAPVVHAYWKYVKDHSPVYTHVCSNCGEGKVFMSSYEMRLHNEYCSRCGAKMSARKEVTE